MTGAGQALAGLFMAGRDPALPTNSLDKAVLISLQTGRKGGKAPQRNNTPSPTPLPFYFPSSAPGSSPLATLFQKKEPGATGAPGLICKHRCARFQLQLIFQKKKSSKPLKCISI